MQVEFINPYSVIAVTPLLVMLLCIILDQEALPVQLWDVKGAEQHFKGVH